MNPTALILGVTGGQGSHVARALLRRGWTVRGLTRNPTSASARAIAADGVQLVRGDLDDRSSVAAALEGVQASYVVTDWFKAGLDAEVRWACDAADQAHGAGVHVVYASVVEAHTATAVPHFASKGRVEAHLRARGIRATVLRPGIFFEDLVERRYVPWVTWGMMPVLTGWDTPVPWVALDDLGEAAADALEARQPGVVEVVSDVRSLRELAAAFDARGARPWPVRLPVWLFERLVSAELASMWRWLRNTGRSWAATATTSAEEWLEAA